jgi:hypothetical protein
MTPNAATLILPLFGEKYPSQAFKEGVKEFNTKSCLIILLRSMGIAISLKVFNKFKNCLLRGHLFF